MGIGRPHVKGNSPKAAPNVGLGPFSRTGRARIAPTQIAGLLEYLRAKPIRAVVIRLSQDWEANLMVRVEVAGGTGISA